jgi:enoyl-CoA hydratase/carnithine racemase
MVPEHSRERDGRHGSLEEPAVPQANGRLSFLCDKAARERQSGGMFDLIREGPLARLTLNRPAARNAVPVGAWSHLGDAAEAASAEGASLLLLEGAGSAFCAGADITDFKAMHADAAAAGAFRAAMRDGIERLAAVPIPTIALIHGPCYGAGVALAMACDLRLAGADSSFAITPAKFGISYPQEDIARLVGLVGPGQAARLLYSGATIDAAEALRIGLAELPASAAEDLIAGICENSADSIAALKRSIRLAAEVVATDTDQDRSFDRLLASDALAARLARRKER